MNPHDQEYERILRVQNLGGHCPYCHFRTGHHHDCVMLGGVLSMRAQESALPPQGPPDSIEVDYNVESRVLFDSLNQAVDKVMDDHTREWAISTTDAWYNFIKGQYPKAAPERRARFTEPTQQEHEWLKAMNITWNGDDR